MLDTFKQIRRNDWSVTDPDFRGLGNTKQRNAYRKKQNRRTRRILKQKLQREL